MKPISMPALAGLLLVVALAGCATAPAPTPQSVAAAVINVPPPAPPIAETPSAAALQALPVTLAPSAEPIAEPTTPIEPEDPAVRADLWERVRQGFAMPALEGEHVRKWEQWYASRPEYVQRMTERGGRYLFHIVEEVEKRGMPTELALLPFIESAFNPQAMSSARASGMWQFMPATGRDFELRQNVFRDDRRDVLASTRAALDYLQSLHRMFGDWHLALAAYNWGQGSVQRAMARNRQAGLDTDYVSLRMPDETRNYVPKLQAVINIVARPAAFSIRLPALENHPFFLSVPIVRDIDVALAARLSGLTLDEFQALNPQMNKPVILAAGTPQLLLPFDNARHFQRELARHRGPSASWTAWVAPKTLKPAEAAKAVGMPEAQLREVNRIPARMLVRAGSTLLVPRSAQHAHDVTERVADNATMALSPEARARAKKVGGRKGPAAAGANKLAAASAAAKASPRSGASKRTIRPAANPRVRVAQQSATPGR
jgi:membrane-bound lytic murein transglycosylase D